VLAALCALLAALWARERRAPTPAAPPPPAPDAAGQAAAARARGRAALDEVLGRPAANAAARSARALEVAGVVRATLAELHPASAARTAQDLADDARVTGDRRLALAARLVLAPAERVAFARLAPGAPRLARLSAAARAALAEEDGA
jgi:hypothetical protein